ncbi:MAG: cytochrome c maturation protein CcmE [Planctomycetes bacterium]|nr:cytochrome c maturation protein CcmE [Planctomycetota bacterium]
MKLKHVAALTVIACALGYLGAAGYRSGLVYYVGVEDLLTQTDRDGRRVRVFGTVGTQTERAGASDGEIRFELRGAQKFVPVVYHGAVPDGFASGREVVVEGMLNAEGYLAADVLMTKCASKYQGAASAKKVGG